MNQSITNTDMQKSLALLLQYTANLCSKRLYSEKTVRSKLIEYAKRKNISLTLEISDKIINRLKEVDLINDLKFCKSFIRSKSKKSLVLLKITLAQQCSPDIIEQAIQNLTEQEEIANPQQQIYDFFNSKNVFQLDKTKQLKFINSLVRKGFSYNDINYVLKNPDIFT